ncbi:branched-chain amino acid ABC transporter permease [Dactylosporangium sp. NPDC005572]|uniref:branched-chain amino acid ABC transporter permease n=1 Tax=Dactylosporangium sp. NPDC005572 TaxID=3156889 RepID=UPI0033A2E818
MTVREHSRTSHAWTRALTRQRLDTALDSGRGVLAHAREASVVLFGLLVILIGTWSSPQVQFGLVLSTIYGLVILGNNAVFATLREVSLGSVAPLAVGTYTCAYLVNRDTSVPLAILAATLAGGVLGFVVAVPTTRLSGIATALATFALAFAIPDLATFAVPITGGDAGTYLPTDFSLGPLPITGSGPSMLILTTVVMVVLSLISIRLLNTTVGRKAILVGETTHASAVFGARVQLTKAAVWIWAALLAGLGGALYGLFVGYASPTQFPITLSIYFFVGGLVGGVRSATGAWLGGIVIGGLPQWLQNVVPVQSTGIAYGAVLLVALALGARGLSPSFERFAIKALQALTKVGGNR